MLHRMFAFTYNFPQ